MGVIKTCCGSLVVLLAVLVGCVIAFLNFDRGVAPGEGIVFATMIPLMGGVLPSTLFHGTPLASPKGLNVPELPSGLTMKPSPKNQVVVAMPGGGKMPGSGLGTCCRPNVYEYESVYRQIMHFFSLGGRHIDTAALYLNHAPIGKAISDSIKDYGLTREEIFITTKVFYQHFGRETVKKVVRGFVKGHYASEEDHYNWEKDTTRAQSLASPELKGYIDLLLVHVPYSIPSMAMGSKEASLETYGLSEECKQKKFNTIQCRQDTWLGLSELRKEGIIKDAGVSNFEITHMEQIMAMEDVAPIAANQFEYNPFSKPDKHELFDYCVSKGVAVMPYFSVGAFFNKDKLTSDPDLLGLSKIMKKHSKTMALILQKWAVQKGAAVIPGSGNPKHMAENLGVHDFTLTAEEMGTIDKLREHPLSKVLTAGTMEYSPQM